MHSGLCDEVWLVPCGPRPDKPKLKTPALDRYCMCQISVNTVFSPEFPIKAGTFTVYIGLCIVDGVINAHIGVKV